jgi:hypothetical protein
MKNKEGGKMDKISLMIIIDKLTNLSDLGYNETIDSVEMSFRLDSIIDELTSYVEYCD